MVKRRSNLLTPALFSLAALGAVVFWRSPSQTPSVNVAVESSPTPEAVTTGIAADGKISLTLNEKAAGEKTAWTLATKDKNGAVRQIWSETLPAGVTFSIPGNAVSPDDKYLFIQETLPGKTLYLVFSVDGKPLKKDLPLIEFTEAFAVKYPNLKITEATGWAAPTLIVFNTDKAEGGTGPSFWFDILSQSFIQLTNRFN